MLEPVFRISRSTAPAFEACQANSRGTNGIHHEQLRQRRQQLVGDAAKRHERAIEADEKPRRDFFIETHPRKYRGTGGMTDRDLRLDVERAQ